MSIRPLVLSDDLKIPDPNYGPGDGTIPAGSGQLPS
jgi:hypothetical protein